MILKKLGKGLKVVGGTTLKNIGRLFGAVGYLAISLAGTIFLGGGIGMICGAVDLKNKTEQAIKDSDDYKAYRIAEDERLEKLYNNKIADKVVKFENGEISEPVFSIIKNFYDNEVLESNNVYHYLQVTDNNTYDQKFKNSALLIKFGALSCTTAALIGVGRFINLLSEDGDMSNTLAGIWRGNALDLVADIFTDFGAIKSKIKGEDDEEEGEETQVAD